MPANKRKCCCGGAGCRHCGINCATVSIQNINVCSDELAVGGRRRFVTGSPEGSYQIPFCFEELNPDGGVNTECGGLKSFCGKMTVSGYGPDPAQLHHYVAFYASALHVMVRFYRSFLPPEIYSSSGGHSDSGSEEELYTLEVTAWIEGGRQGCCNYITPAQAAIALNFWNPCFNTPDFRPPGVDFYKCPCPDWPCSLTIDGGVFNYPAPAYFLLFKSETLIHGCPLPGQTYRLLNFIGWDKCGEFSGSSTNNPNTSLEESTGDPCIDGVPYHDSLWWGHDRNLITWCGIAEVTLNGGGSGSGSGQCPEDDDAECLACPSASISSHSQSETPSSSAASSSSAVSSSAASSSAASSSAASSSSSGSTTTPACPTTCDDCPANINFTLTGIQSDTDDWDFTDDSGSVSQFHQTSPTITNCIWGVCDVLPGDAGCTGTGGGFASEWAAGIKLFCAGGVWVFRWVYDSDPGLYMEWQAPAGPCPPATGWTLSFNNLNDQSGILVLSW